MARRRDVSGITRPLKMEISIDRRLQDDLEQIGKAWGVPRSTAAYWLLRGLIADARGDTFVVMGDDYSEKLARWLLRFFPTPEKEEK